MFNPIKKVSYEKLRRKNRKHSKQVRRANDNWQDVIIDLSNNDENIVKYLETNYK